MTTTEQLTQVFADNFMAYFRSHVAHANIQGRNFYSDHKLLRKIYEDLQEQIDIIAEILRSMESFMPDDLTDVMSMSSVSTMAISGTADDLLDEVKTDLEQLKGCYQELVSVADAEEYLEISNYAQERVLALAKHIWMLDSTLS
jgi:starvation-inducible DNA-binding protein